MDTKLINLPRGGVLIRTSEGPIQFGSPPETLKDTMQMSTDVPKIFVLPKDFFHLEKGISVAEIEFPIYYNYFLKQQNTKVICPANRMKDLETALHESIFGPETINLKPEFHEQTPSYFIPDIASEVAHFRAGMKLSDLVELIPFQNGSLTLGDVKISMDPKDGDFKVYEKNKLIADIPGTIQFNVQLDVGEVSSNRFTPPRMGMTCLGSSHGFDPKQNTSGFILWLNNRGIMIDPPVASSEWLQQSNVNPKYIDSIILTHCHADHDAGTFQKILAEAKVNIYTTDTVMTSFLKKYSALTRIPQEQLLEMFNFFPIAIDQPVYIHQGIFDFFYTFHAIPTVGFKVKFREKTLVYSSDHLNEPDIIEKLYNDGVFTEARKDFLRNFPWEADIIYHEAGIPPLHTPVSYLNTLPEEIQKRTIVYHIAEKDFPEDTQLTLAQFGIEHTNIIEVPSQTYDSACDLLNFLEKVEYFNSFTLTRIRGLLSELKYETFSKGEVIIQKGTQGEKFYIMISGHVLVEDIDTDNYKSYGEYDTFGEASLILDEPRHASVVAQTDVEVMTIHKNAFLSILRGTRLEKRLIHLSKSRSADTWDILNDSSYFKHTTSFQKTAFETILTPYKSLDNEVLIQENHTFDVMYLIGEGSVHRIKDKKPYDTLGRGDLVGDIVRLQKNLPSIKSCIAKGVCTLYKIGREDMLDYIETYPNIYMNLLYRS